MLAGKEKGQAAYEAYAASCPILKFTGETLPAWANIDPELKPHWAKVEEDVIGQFVHHVATSPLPICLPAKIVANWRMLENRIIGLANNERMVS